MERIWSDKTNSPLKSTTIGFWPLRINTALAVGEVVMEAVVDTGVVTSGAVVVEAVVDTGVVISGAVVVSMQLNSSHGQPPRQFC